MKQFLFVAIAALALLSSCTKTPSVSVDLESEEEVYASGGTVKVHVTSDGEWSTSIGEWTDSDNQKITTSDTVNLSHSSGSGEQDVDITVPANTSGVGRNMIVTFYSVLGASSQEVKIHQETLKIEVNPKKIDNISASGGTVNVTVTSEGGWRSSADDGIAVNPSSGSGDNVQVSITVPANTTAGEREVKVIFCSALNTSVSETVTIHQNSPDIEVTPSKFEDIPASGKTVDVYVTSNGKWKTTPDDGITVNPSSGDQGSNVQVSITVPKNTSAEGKELKVVFFSELNEEASQTVTISQKAPGVSVKTVSNNVTAEGGTVDVEVTSDGGWKVEVPEVEGRYKVTPSGYSNSGMQQARITVYANITKEQRDVKIKFCSELNDNVSETVSIPQKYINISVAPQTPDDEKDVSVSGGKINLTLISNGSWNTSIGKWTGSDGQTLTTADEVTLSASSGSGSNSVQSVEVNIPKNSSGKERSVQVNFYSIHDNSISSAVTIHQKASK